jgi:hypothetical protein
MRGPLPPDLLLVSGSGRASEAQHWIVGFGLFRESTASLKTGAVSGNSAVNEQYVVVSN